MNDNYHKPTVNRAPDWWQHPIQAWIDLSDFYSDDGLTNPANWRRLNQGQTNYNYELTLTGKNHKKNYFVQVVNINNLAMLPQGDKDQAVQPVLSYLANKSSIEPWLVDCYLCTPSIRVFDWVNFKPLTANCFNPELSSSQDLAYPFTGCDAFLLTVVDFMTSLHDLEASSQQQQPVRLDIQKHLRGYHQLAKEHAPEHSKTIERLLTQSLPIAEKFSPDKFCHNDLSLNNLLWIGEQGRLKVIDWEYACFSDPTMDLAGFLLNFQLNSQQQQHFVEQYSTKTGTQINPDKLRNMKQLCQNISALWQFCSS